MREQLLRMREQLLRMRELALQSIWLLIASAGSIGAAAERDVSPGDVTFFESKIRPLLVENCYECHSKTSGESEGGLRLDTAAAILTGGDQGPALVSGDADASLIVRAVSYDDANLQMPPDGKLDAESISALRDWIATGAPDPRVDSPDVLSMKQSPADRDPMDRDPMDHWAFKIPKRAAGRAHASLQSLDVIDDFVADRAKAMNLQLNEQADLETLIRRLYFDLSGLSPDADAITRFTRSNDPAAYVRIVDSLLSRPEFGERFGRHWLDVARYADTLGYTTAGRKREIEGSHLFRDWVIRAFAGDMPYDEMLRLQLAADRIDPANEAGNLDAMGFLTIGRQYANGYDTIDDRIDVISRGLIGLTVACARCHDHKFDPIPTADYYSLLSVLSNSHQPSDRVSPLAMVDRPRLEDHRIFIRGQSGNRGPVAPRQYLTALRKPDDGVFREGSGRLELAERIASSENPLTARVLVNRLWLHLIGRPLVDTPSDFGFRTLPPQVPEVLDDLAADFASHWSIKRTVRRIVLSHIYRQSSVASDAAIQIDPENRWLCRGNRRRRDFESLRDCIHVAADSLDRTVGGESSEITLDTPAPRRTIYAKIDRQNLPSVFRVFDFASPDAHSPGRHFTTVPQQALYLVNSKQMLDLAGRVARAAQRDAASASQNELVTSLFRRVLQRTPSAEERQFANHFLDQPTSPLPKSIDARRVWSYGTAVIDEKARVQSFHPFTVFRNNQWQASKKFPGDGPLGYASLGRENGHPGEGDHGAAVRRFTSPLTGNVRIIGVMGHRSQEGDGVRAKVWVADRSVFDLVHKSNDRPYGPIKSRVTEGQHIDFAAIAGETLNHDSFYWRIRIHILGDNGEVFESESTRDFSGPLKSQPDLSLDRFSQLAQVLFMSNEFAFVD